MEYEKAFSQVQAKVERFSLPSPSYEWNLADMLPALDSLTAGDAVLICNPNNPTGTLIRRTELEKLAEDLQERQIFLILDEAFMDFLDDEEDYSSSHVWPLSKCSSGAVSDQVLCYSRSETGLCSQLSSDLL